MEAHGETVIHTAIRLGIESHFSLLTRIADIETPNAEGVTALQLAQSESKPQFVRMLREAGASFSGERV
jgi:ankyrin repeat protein